MAYTKILTKPNFHTKSFITDGIIDSPQMLE